jgi:hypothetical protein
MDDRVSFPAAAELSSAGARSENGGATRYFAAAAYHDPAFRKQVLEFLRHGWYRARAPEFGIDEAVVAHHCRRAARRETIRDGVMLLVFLVFAWGPIGELLAEPQYASEILAYYAPNLILAVLAASLVLAVERIWTEHYITARSFGRGMMTEAGSPAAPAAPAQNLVIYGAYSPFVGSGYRVGGWSFSVNLERTRSEFGVSAPAEPFEPRDLTRFVESRFDRLRIAGISRCEVLFVDGKGARDNAAQLFSDGQPRRRISPEAVERLADSLGQDVRSYLCINVTDWSGELVLSVYLRCKKGESNLFIEASYFLLAPPKRAFFRIEELDPQLHIMTVVRSLFRSAMLSAFVLAGSVFRLGALAVSPLTHVLERGSIVRLMERNRRFNIGAITSIRELGMENYYRVYFQELDKERHVKTIEQCTIDAMVEFLDLHNIDTSDIRDRRSAILNNGVIVAGGELKAGNMAVGQGAKAAISRLGARMARVDGGAGAGT